MDKEKSTAEPTVEQAENAVNLSDLTLTWTRQNPRNTTGEISGHELARILGTLDRIRYMADWTLVLNADRAQCLLIGVKEILASVIGQCGELSVDGLGIISNAVEEAQAILDLIPLSGPEAFTVHLAPAAAGGAR